MDEQYDMSVSRRTLDRLVDGELTDQEVKRVISACEMEMDAWRRCALAFIERQMWERDLGEIATPNPTLVTMNAPAKDIAAASVLKRDKSHPRWYLPLTLVASMLLAFFLARGFEDWFPSTGDQPERDKTAKQQGKSSDQVDPSVDIREVSTDPAGRLSLSLDDGDQPGQKVEIPFYNQDQLDEEKLATMRSDAVPEHVVQQLKREGHRVVRKQQVLQVDLENGTTVVIPVEQVEIVPVSRPVQ